MHSQLIPGLPFQTYGLCVAAGALAGAWIIERLSGRKEAGALVAWLVLAGIAGARIAHVVEYWHADGFDRDFASVFAIWKGGLVFYGGLAGSIVAFLAWCAAKRENPLAWADLLCVAIPLGHAFGRIGCFFHGCCWGKVSQSALAVTFPAGSPAWHARHASSIAARSLPVLPVQLFEAAALATLFALLLLLYRRFKAFTAAAYFASYGVIRFLLEFLRDDERPSAFGLSSAQLFSIALAAAGAAIFAISLCRRHAEHTCNNR